MIGKIVHFFPGEEDGLAKANGATCVPAIVVQEFGQRMNLKIFCAGGADDFKWSSPHKDIAGNGQGYWDFIKE